MPAIDLHIHVTRTTPHRRPALQAVGNVLASVILHIAPALGRGSHLGPVGFVVGLEALVVAIDRLLSSA